MKILKYWIGFTALLLCLGLSYLWLQTPDTTGMSRARVLSEEFGTYWFSGEAEITSYTITQARYGELREGTAVLIFVTEPFSTQEQVKTERNDQNRETVLKLNFTRDFITGIYPYHLMSSTFLPTDHQGHAIKVSASIQEWCGQVYIQLNNREQFQWQSHSYFEDEADQYLEMEAQWLENEIWNLIRIAPEELPTGELYMYPSLEYLRLKHLEIKPYQCKTSLIRKENEWTYQISYPELGRELSISFRNEFPYEIEEWTEIAPENMLNGRKSLISQGKKLRRIKSAYWKQNANTDLYLRDSLGL